MPLCPKAVELTIRIVVTARIRHLDMGFSPCRLRSRRIHYLSKLVCGQPPRKRVSKEYIRFFRNCNLQLLIRPGLGIVPPQRSTAQPSIARGSEVHSECRREQDRLQPPYQRRPAGAFWHPLIGLLASTAAESARGISRRATHRSVLEPPDSHGSCHPLKAAAFRRNQSAPLSPVGQAVYQQIVDTTLGG